MALPSIQVCEYCNKSFPPKNNDYRPRRFCSYSCSRRATVAKTKPPSSIDEMGHLILRVCKACHLSKPLLSIYFKPHGKPKQGWLHTCKVCKSAQKSLYNTAHRTEINRTTKAWRKANPDKRRTETARYRAKHREQLRAAENLRRTVHAAEIRLRRMLVPLRKRRKWSKQWEKANQERRRELNARRRALRLNAPHIEEIDREAIYARDKWICQLCFKKVRRKDASLDHVIPLSKNGDHTAQNQVLVHGKCNSGKRDRDVPQQMRLFG